MKTLIICSGGLDSVAMAGIHKEDELTLMTFNYGQKGIKELDIVDSLGKKLGRPVIKVDINFMGKLWGDSNQLTGKNVKVEKEYSSSVIVPLRNGVFTQIAMAYAYSNNFDRVMLGSHLDDILEIDGERMMPDCSPEFFKSFQLACDLGTPRKDKTVEIVTASLLGWNKKTLITKGIESLGDFLFSTWSCYESNEKQCGKCNSCINRRKLFESIGVEDKTEYLE